LPFHSYSASCADNPFPSARSELKKRANYVSHCIPGVLYSRMRFSFVCLVPIHLRRKAQGPLPQIEISEARRNESAGRPAIFGCFAQKFHGKRSAAPECAAANRQGRCQRSWPIQRGAGLPPYRVVFRAGQAVNNPRLSRSRKFFVSSPFVSTPISFVVNNCPREPLLPTTSSLAPWAAAPPACCRYFEPRQSAISRSVFAARA
jgi:hypothetical protein